MVEKNKSFNRVEALKRDDYDLYRKLEIIFKKLDGKLMNVVGVRNLDLHGISSEDVKLI